jgi:predicted nucleic acid-binding protein
MSKVFIDTWAWYALTDIHDADHDIARISIDDLLTEDARLITTNFVFAEAITLVRYNLHHAAALRLNNTIRSLIENKTLDLIRVTAENEADAWSVFERYHDQKLSYVDCVTCAVMHAFGIERVFSADHHFSVFGFTLVP